MRIIELKQENNWIEKIADEANQLKMKLGDVVIEIHHIGSTAIPGIFAKPTIDIILEVNNIADLDEKATILEELGYDAKGEFGVTGRRYFQKGGDNRTHHMHAFASGSKEIARHLLFRDYLRAHKHKANEYETLKLNLATKFKFSPEEYAQGKNELIEKLENEALVWTNS